MISLFLKKDLFTMYVAACVYTTVCLYVAACVYVTACVMYVHSVYGCPERPDSSTPLLSRNLPRRQRSNLIKARASSKLLLGHLAVPGEWGVLLKKTRPLSRHSWEGVSSQKCQGREKVLGPGAREGGFLTPVKSLQ